MKRFQGMARAGEPDEIYSAGLEGLIEAARRFDPAAGVSFAHFATIRIRGAIQDFLRRQDPLSRANRARVIALERAQIELAHRLGRWPTPMELALSLGRSRKEIQADLALQSTRTISIGNVVQRSDDVSFVDIEDNSEETNPLTRLESLLINESLWEVLDELPSRDRQLLEMRYYQELPLAEIGRKFGISESGVAQQHRRVLQRLAKRLSPILDAAA